MSTISMMVKSSINQFHLDDGMMVGNHQTIIRQIQTTISGFCSLGLFTNGHSPDCSQEPKSKHKELSAGAQKLTCSIGGCENTNET